VTVENYRDKKRGLHINEGVGGMRQRYHSTMNNSVQKYNRATNGNKAAYLILGIYISAVFDKVIMHGSYMHARLAILQRQYHHPTQQQAAAVVTVGKYRD